MNFEKYTINAQKSVAAAQTLAVEHASASIEPEHLALALVRQQESVVPALLGKLGVNVQAFESDLLKSVERLAKVSGGSQPSFSRETDAVIRQAEKEAVDEG